MTGHAAGLITIEIAEADEAERERHRRDMVEPYRTLLGHFRHEVSQYYWERLLVRDGVWHEAFRELFGGERRDYGAALAAHYASAHPWEDFAETWAHYLHIVDTLETAKAFGLRVRPEIDCESPIGTEIGFDPPRRFRRADRRMAAPDLCRQ